MKNRALVGLSAACMSALVATAVGCGEPAVDPYVPAEEGHGHESEAPAMVVKAETETAETEAAEWVWSGPIDPHNKPGTKTHASFTCEKCHDEQVIQCAMCHADYFTEVPEGWSLPAHTNQLWPEPLAE